MNSEPQAKRTKNLSMADLLAKQNNDQDSSRNRLLSVSRGQQLEGEVISISHQELVLDLGTKAEGILPKRDLSTNLSENIKIGDKLNVVVIFPENESGQVVLSMHKPTSRNVNVKWGRFQKALEENKSLVGKGVEVNRGGLLVEIGEIRGFLPSSQVSLSQVNNLEELIGKEISVNVIEVDSEHNRLIFSQRASISEQVKENLSKLKIGDNAEGVVAAVLPFGIFVSLPEGVEGLVHVSEVSWEKIDDPSSLFKVGDEVTAQVISVDQNTNRVNLSIKQLQDDPFGKISEKYAKDDIVKGIITKVSSNGVNVNLEDGFEGVIPTAKIDSGAEYVVGQKIQCLIDNIDIAKRRVYLSPFRTSTKDLIYK